MSESSEGTDVEAEKPPFPSDEELLKAGYVLARFSTKQNITNLKTNLGHPFPTHEEIVAAGYVPLSRSPLRIQSRPRVAQMYWVDFAHDACAPEFVNEHPGIVIRAARSLDHDTCVVLPVTSSEQKAGTHFHKLSNNPNRHGQGKGIIAYAVCDHLYTVNNCRLRPLVGSNGKPYFPRVHENDMLGIYRVLEAAFSRQFVIPIEKK